MPHAPRTAGTILTAVLRPRLDLACAFGAAAALTAGAPAASAAVPAWWSYDRPETFGARSTQVKVPMRDGIELGCDLHRPATRSGAVAPGRFPSVVYEVTPYALNNLFYLEQGDYFARHGYNAIMCNVRGTGRSGGSFPQMNQPAEQTDAYDLVEWIASRSFADGAVGQTGESYGGMSTYRAAASRAPHLRAIAPQQAPNDLYLEDIYPGGVPARPLTQNWWPALAGLTSFGRVDPGRIFAVQQAHPTRDAFWQQVAIDSVLDRVDVPVLAFGGWQDPLFRSGSLRNYERLVSLGNPHTYLIYGPWTHGEVIDWKGCKLVALACTSISRVPPGALLAWFDRWVAGRSDAPLPNRRVASFQLPHDGGVGWRELQGLPDEGMPEQSLAMGADATLTSAPGVAGVRSYVAGPFDGILGGIPSVDFTGPSLEQTTDLAGRPAIDLAFTSSASDANLRVELRLASPDGDQRTIADGFLRGSHHRSHESPTPLVPGAVTRATVELDPVDRRLAAGSRLSLRITSGDAGKYVPVSGNVRVGIRVGAGGSVLRVRTRAVPG